MSRQIKKINQGFTLIELLVVVSIISLLSTVVLSSLRSARNKAKNTALLQELLALRDAMYIYRTDNGNYGISVPTGSVIHHSDINGSSSMQNVLSALVSGGYIAEIPHHPNWPNNGSGNYLEISANPTFGNGAAYVCGVVDSPEDATTKAQSTNGIIKLHSVDPEINLPEIEAGVTYVGADFYGSYHYSGEIKTYCIPF